MPHVETVSVSVSDCSGENLDFPRPTCPLANLSSPPALCGVGVEGNEAVVRLAGGRTHCRAAREVQDIWNELGLEEMAEHEEGREHWEPRHALPVAPRTPPCGKPAPVWGSIRTARALRRVFEQLLQEMVYQERSCRGYLVGSEALPFPLIGSG